jgi:hypothetical protein
MPRAERVGRLIADLAQVREGQRDDGLVHVDPARRNLSYFRRKI